MLYSAQIPTGGIDYLVNIFSMQEFVARYEVGTIYSDAAKCFIDDKLPEAIRYSNWIIPIKTTGNKCPLNNEADHWSVLTYNVKCNIWTYYDSLKSSLVESVHLTSARILVRHLPLAG